MAKLITRRCVAMSKVCGQVAGRCVAKLQEYVWLSLLQKNGWLGW